MVSVVRSHFPTHEYVDWAIYFAVSGSRGVRTSICQNLGDPTYPLHLATGLGVIAIFIALLRNGARPSLPAALLAAVPPFLFLSVVANDLSRWTVLAALNVWLLSAVGARAQPAAMPTSVRPWRRPPRESAGDARHPADSSEDVAHRGPIFSPAPVIDRARAGLGGPENAALSRRLARCDPDWRSVLGDPPGSDAGR